MRVNFIRRQFLHEPLRLIEREEFRYAHADERRLFLLSNVKFRGWGKVRHGTYGVFKLGVDLGNYRAHGFELREHVFGRVRLTSHKRRHLRSKRCKHRPQARSKIGPYLIKHGSDAPAQRRQLPQGLFKNAGKGKKAEGVSSRRSVEHDHRVFHRLDVPARTVRLRGCAEGGRDVLHDFGKGHGLVYAGNGERKVLHHGAHHAILIRC